MAYDSKQSKMGIWRWRPCSSCLCAVLALLGSCSALAACGSIANPGTPAGSAAHVPGKHDRDNDSDNNDDDAQIVYYGRAAQGAERAAVVALVRRYYAAALAGDGAAGCPLLSPQTREQLVEEDGGTAKLRGHSCPTVLTKLFATEHRELAHKSPGMTVQAVRVGGGIGVALIEFPPLRELRKISIHRIAGVWLLHDLRDRFIE